MKIDPPLRADRGAYYEEAASWAHDMQAVLLASRRIAWIIAGAASAIAIMEAIAITALAPLKTIVPYVLTVDRQTGYTQLAQGLTRGPMSEDAAITQAFLAQYVIARETFDINDLQTNYKKVAQWTIGAGRDEYIRSMAAVNPQSPVAKYRQTTIVQTTIKSVSLLSKTSALVRFETEQSADGANQAESRPYTAVIAFRFSGTPMTMEERFVNPLGFQVTSYRRDAETVGPIARPEATR
jgi:type IV secretion system protein VirB8